MKSMNDRELKELDDARKQNFEKFSKLFSFDEWNKLSGSEQEDFEQVLHFDILHSLKAWLTTEYKENDVGDFFTLDQMIEDCYLNCISDYDGSGEWEFIQESTGKHFRGKTDIDFSCSYINNFFNSVCMENLDNPTFRDTYKNFMINFLKNNLEFSDFKLIGIRWYNK